MAKQLGVEAFLELGQRYPIIDVRTPAEFAKGHIPGAANIPLFSNEERARIGAAYKQVGQTEAMLQGLEVAGPKLRALVEQAQAVAPGETALLHCWRGGLRSESVAWLLDLFGWQSYTLSGGYKAFRNYALSLFQTRRPIYILAGRTGSGKTEILREMARRGEQVIDLEALAHHKGSSFGSLGQAPQPTQQQFENNLASALQRLDPAKPVWLEDESRRIGSLSIPLALWRQMEVAFTLFIEAPVALRTQALIREYGDYQRGDLKEAITRLQKRLGHLNTERALEALEAGESATCCQLLLRHYYDKTYDRSLARRDPQRVKSLELHSTNAAENAERVLGVVFT